MHGVAAIPNLPPALPARSLRVLIVEDEPRLRELLADVVPEMGFPATAVRSAEDAARVMASDPHEIMILDLHLPLAGGMELFERVRRDWAQTQVIVLTGYGDLPTAQRAIRLDVVEFLSKPCHLRDLEIALDHARRRRLATGDARTPVAPDAPAAPPPSERPVTTLAESERLAIIAALQRHGGNRTAAAAELGISRRTLHYRLNEYRARGQAID